MRRRATARFTGMLGTAYPSASERRARCGCSPSATGRTASASRSRALPGRSCTPRSGAVATEIRLEGGFKPGRIYRAHLHGARSDRRRARNGGHPRPLVLSADHPLAGQPPPQKRVIFGISQSGRLIQTMLLRGLHVDEDGSAGVRRRLHPRRRRRQGRLRLSLRHADAAFQRARGPHLSDRLLSVRDRRGARSRDRRRGLGAGSGRARSAPSRSSFTSTIRRNTGTAPPR